MTAPLTLLIVEDETPLAEMHAEYIRHIPGFSQILLAGNLAQARMMIERFKPGLILLDNYLPDGRGIMALAGSCPVAHAQKTQSAPGTLSPDARKEKQPFYGEHQAGIRRHNRPQ